ncbi:bifunctional isocitrate dehydrogenase kinase/phosphatase [Paraneptunicella aestuarii]|uniref:bifunctional isocitrate dehydrogenase kinase/phosphatase n=1 Tax=Paraneptunicella aestuarii TaxID=2831148 RepID=UPI001E5E5168|nr:bifunctional isocitrate dehydrogenase kinase/phosphatase [Paraneptunicella aestuarii]UAA39770.1 bifunctional isocitrate dehydrogenase kinase/phosphatase [Paraneptunicella aestuarii]
MPNSDNYPPHQVAYAILKGFDKSFRLYCNITAEAKQRFEKAQWHACQQASKKRIDLYEQSLNETVTGIYEAYLPQKQKLRFWQNVKREFIQLIDQHPQFELAETFFNSVIGRVFKHQLITDDIMFVHASRCHLNHHNIPIVVNTFETQHSVRSTIENIFKQYSFRIPFENYERDLDNVSSEIESKMDAKTRKMVEKVELLKSVFYRGKAAYLIGRICMPQESIPFVIVLQLSDEGEIYVDTLLTDRRDFSVLFGFARAYFMADTQHPAAVVEFLQELLPNKKNFELYTALGFYKHGKTVFYRNYLEHMANSDDKFEIAPGIKGLVMQVFHLPSYGVVFKIIRDEFGESKKITRDDVIDRYKLVKNHDRIGRMADTHEFSNFCLPKDRISDALMKELQESCSKSIEINDTHIIIKHMYIERKMTPLNLYLEQENLTEEDIRSAVYDLGKAIKQIAAANIFPGDMLHKNFGITRHGRVIFYDYDEICYMSERNFRALPHNDDPYAMDTLSVAPNDVFPEQFEHFILGKKHLKQIFKELHSDLFSPEYWKDVQAKLAKGEILHVVPYPESQRFKR